MTSPKMQLLEKQLRLRQQTPEKAPAVEGDGALAGAIQALVQQEIAKALAARQETAPGSPKVRSLMRDLYPGAAQPPVQPPAALRPPQATTPAPMPREMRIERDGAGLARAIVINGQRFLIQRGADGHMVRMVPEDMATEVRYDGRYVEPAPLNDPNSDAGPTRRGD